ncbi:hypothetical protein [Mycolicibacterium sp. 120270]|uniref:hypothetical protein n=1 Tax=Mycolicibacterium sp. 120270 TaxID=3090600 RepID=UPI00299D7569|nr:hypothetical protein [Mycolicibacterium sp. 120270]MDX1882151.1 hypothetical protein [Mycolicibacterium sp. 120270]
MSLTALYLAHRSSAGYLSAGDQIRVAHGVFGKLGRVSSTSPGHVVVHYDRGGREVIDLTRRSVWMVD